VKRMTIGEQVDKHGMSEAFLAVADAFLRRDVAPIKDKIVTETFGKWIVCVNGTRETVKAEPEGTMGCNEVPPVHAALFYNGWLAGLISPAGGWIAAGEGANEATFIEAIRS